MPTINLTITRMHKVNGAYFFDVVFNNAIKLMNFSLRKNDKGEVWLSTPREKREDKYYDYAFSWFFEKKKKRSADADELCEQILDAAKKYLRENKDSIPEGAKEGKSAGG